MRKLIIITLINILLTSSLLAFGTLNNAGAKYNPTKDYYDKYKRYKERYKDLYEDYKDLKEDYEDRGIELESYYMDLIQCQRAINGDNPWEFMIEETNKK